MADFEGGVIIGGELLSSPIRAIEPEVGYDFMRARIDNSPHLVIVGLMLVEADLLRERSINALQRYFALPKTKPMEGIDLDGYEDNNWKTDLIVDETLTNLYSREARYWPKVPGTNEPIAILPAPKPKHELAQLIADSRSANNKVPIMALHA